MEVPYMNKDNMMFKYTLYIEGYKQTKLYYTFSKDRTGAYAALGFICSHIDDLIVDCSISIYDPKKDKEAIYFNPFDFRPANTYKE